MTAAGGQDRIVTLDVIRGIAVMGIFSVNVIAFAMPTPAYFNPAAYGSWHAYDYGLWVANFILVDGKMRGLFSMLFGASAMLVIDRAEASGRSPAATHYARMATLLLLGCAHFYLLWFGDILTLYAVCGLLLYFVRNWPVRWLLTMAALLLVMDVAMMGAAAGWFLGTEAAALKPGASAKALQAYAELRMGFGAPDPKALAADLSVFRGDWWTIVHHRMTKQVLEPLQQLSFAAVETLGYMALGAAGYRSGFLTGAWETRRYRRIALLLLVPGIAAFAALAWLANMRGFLPGTMAAIQFFATLLPRLAMMLGYAALIALWAKGGGALVARVGAVGRSAFSNYLGTSIAAGFVFYGYGLSLYGHVSRFEAWLVVPLFWAVMLLWSQPWLARFRYGPFEWLWRSLSRGQIQPMRK